MIKEKIAKLIDLKTIITILMIGTLVFGFIKEKINSNEFIPLVSLIVTSYFTKKDSDSK